MASTIANCTCKFCGKSFEHQLLEYGKGANKRLREKLKWAESGGINACPECWKTNKRQEEIEKGLICEVRLCNPMYKCSALAYAVFSGNTIDNKEKLKSSGCRWTDQYPDKNMTSEIFGLSMQKSAWVYKSDNLEEIRDLARSLNAKLRMPDGMDLALWESVKQKAEENRQKEQELRNQQLEELGPIPKWPKSFSAKWPSDAKWNRKVYGKKGNRYVFFGGEKVAVTEEEAKEVERVLQQRTEWEKKKKKIMTSTLLEIRMY